MLLDISDPAHPTRIDAVSDSNFSYWHSATFNNDGTKVLFSDEWGGGGQPKCRETDPKEWGADAIFTIVEPQAAVPELLQDAGGSDAAGKLRRPQRLADSDSGTGRDGAGVVSGRASRSSTGPTLRTPRKSPSSIAARSTRPGWGTADIGPRTGITA